MRPLLLALPALLLLPACHASVDIADKDQGDNVHIAMGDNKGKDDVSLQVPGLSAKVSLPDLHLGTHMDMDGIKLAPDTAVKTIDVVGDDTKGSDGRVHMDFINPGTPASLIDYYKRAAIDAGYSDVAATAAGVSAVKGRKQFALTVSPEGGGTRGTIVMHGSD